MFWIIVCGFLSILGIVGGQFLGGVFFGVVCIILISKQSSKMPKDELQEKYKLLDKNPNQYQENLIQKIFSLALQNDGLWRVDISQLIVKIYKKDGSYKLIPLSELGYDNLNLSATVWDKNKGMVINEFSYRVKRAAESRGYLVWTTKRDVAVKGNTYTTYDEGMSYTRNDSEGTVITGVNICSQEYYRIYKPF